MYDLIMEHLIFNELCESRIKLDFRSDPQYCDWYLRSANSICTIFSGQANIFGDIDYIPIYHSSGIIPACVI